MDVNLNEVPNEINNVFLQAGPAPEPLLMLNPAASSQKCRHILQSAVFDIMILFQILTPAGRGAHGAKASFPGVMAGERPA
jgi:hypothetical protein